MPLGDEPCPDDGREHGVYRTYANHKNPCRGTRCRWAYLMYHWDYIARKTAEAKATGYAGREHGTPTTYRLGCKCDQCTGAEAIRRHERYVAWRDGRDKSLDCRRLSLLSGMLQGQRHRSIWSIRSGTVRMRSAVRRTRRYRPARRTRPRR